MTRQLSLEHMHAANRTLVTELYGQDFAELSAHDALSGSAVIEANHALAEYLYGAEVARLVRGHDFAALNEIYDNVLTESSSNVEALDGADLRKLGMIVVRPELAEETAACADFLATKRLVPVLQKHLTLTFEQYWGLYHHGLLDPDSYHDFPTRTVNYVGKKATLLVVTAQDTIHEPGQTVAEYIVTFKGKQGVYTPDTLRGDLAYTPLQAHLGAAADRFRSSSSTIALDPIGAYRHLVRGTIASDRMHQSADSPLLFYAGQGVHVPDDNELVRDLSILCTSLELGEIATNLALFHDS